MAALFFSVPSHSSAAYVHDSQDTPTLRLTNARGETTEEELVVEQAAWEDINLVSLPESAETLETHTPAASVDNATTAAPTGAHAHSPAAKSEGVRAGRVRADLRKDAHPIFGSNQTKDRCV